MSWDKFLNHGRLRSSTRTSDRAIDPRNEYESDFGRVIFSPATRRMHDKTQVFPLTTDDNIHSRLTHSMEVMSIGHSLGLRVCESQEFLDKTGLDKEQIHRTIPVILKNACLVHDIGNPPFGHFGETVIAGYFKQLFAKDDCPVLLNEEEKKDFLHFDGNAQGFRVLTKLQALNDTFGLNLTFATLGAYTKYPNFGEIDDANIATSKRGVYQSEIPYLKQIAQECGIQKGDSIMRHPLSFLMEAADSICYLIIDIEDGFNKGWYGYDMVRKALAGVNHQGLKQKLDELDLIEGQGKEISKMVNLRIYVIAELVKFAVNKYVENIDAIMAGEYHKELLKEDETGLRSALKSFCVKHIFSKREILQLELTGHSVITGLLDLYIQFVFGDDEAYRNRALGMISNSIKRAALLECEKSDFMELSDYYKLRVIVDFISGMTDKFALQQYQQLSGQKIS